jgi:LacI family transcriptional regulator
MGIGRRTEIALLESHPRVPYRPRSIERIDVLMSGQSSPERSKQSEASLTRPPTMRDVAAAAGVSVMTVSRVVNGRSTVDPAMAERVNQAIRTLGFEPNGMARDLRYGSKTATIGLIVEDLANPFYFTLMRIVEQVARSHDALLITSSSEEDASREGEVISALVRRRVSGLLIIPTAGRRSNVGHLPAIPMVMLDRPSAETGSDTVLIDSFGGAKAGTERLIAAGHRRIAVLGRLTETYTSAERLRGFEEAMREAGIEVNPSLVRLGAHTEGQAAAEAAALMDAADPPTAFLCFNNRMTSGLVEELDRRHVVLDIAGFDEIPGSQYFPMPVTFITYDLEQMGRWATDMLFRRIDGDTSPPKSRVVRTSLVTRGRRMEYLSNT